MPARVPETQVVLGLHLMMSPGKLSTLQCATTVCRAGLFLHTWALPHSPTQTPAWLL